MIKQIKIPVYVTIDLLSNRIAMLDSEYKHCCTLVQSDYYSTIGLIIPDISLIFNFINIKNNPLNKVCAKLKELKFLIAPH